MTESCNLYLNKPKYNKPDKINQILEYLSHHPEGVNPKTIARNCKINHSTVRSYLRQISKLGVLEVPIRGFYKVAKSTHSVPEPKFQNLSIYCIIPNDVEIKRLEEEVQAGHVNCIFQIGARSRKASMRISCSPPLAVDLLYAYGELFKEKVIRYTGFTPELSEIIVSTIEFNWDYFGTRLEGVKCMTFEHTLKVLEKYYSKKYGVRHEIKTLSPFPLERFLLNGNCISTIQGRFDLIEKRLNYTIATASNNRKIIYAHCLKEKLNSSYANKNTLNGM